MASIFRWGNTDNEKDYYSETIIPSSRMKKISSDKALTIPAVKAATDLITNSISQLPIYLYENNENQAGDKIIDDYREKLLNRESNEFQDAQYLKKRLVEDYLFYGKAFIFKKNNELHYLDSSKMKVEKFTQDRITISRREFHYGNSNSVVIPEKDLIIIDSGNEGILYHSAETFELAIAQQEINSAILQNGALPSGVLKATTRLTENAIKRLRESWGSLYSSSKKAGKTIILEEGLDFHPISMNLNELQMSESQKSTLSEIARVFNLPESLINSAANKYDSLSKNNAQFLQHTISPIIVNIESALNRSLLSEEEKENNHRFKFDTSELLRTTENEKVEVVTQGFRSGLYTYNESRTKLDLPKVKNDFHLLSIGSVQFFENGKINYLNLGEENNEKNIGEKIVKEEIQN